MIKRVLLLALLFAGVTLGEVTTETVSVTYSCNGSTTEFDFTWRIFETSDIVVIHRTTATGVETTLTETTDYTVTATNNDFSDGGTVTTVSTYASGVTLTILSDIPDTQQTNLDDAKVLNVDELEDALDRLTLMVQQLQAELDRCVKIPRTESTTVDAASSVDRASSYLAWGSDGSLTNTSGTTSTVTASSFMETVLDDIDGATALATLFNDLTDAERRTWKGQSNQDGWIDVRDYGATGDGTTDDTSAVQAAITAGFASGQDVYFPPGSYVLTPITHTFADAWVPPIRIFGNRSAMIYDVGGGSEKTYLDFTGITTSQVAFEFENTGTSGGLIGLAIEDLEIQGPGTTGSSIAINFKGIAGTAPHGVFMFVRGVGIKNFYQGIHITGTNNWGLHIQDTCVESATIGYNVNNLSTIGRWDNVHAVSCTNGFRLGPGTGNQTFNTPHAENCTNGFVFDTANSGNITDVILINPYFESITDGVLFGYEIDGTANTSNAVRRPIIMGGTWSVSGTEIKVTPGRMNDPYIVGTTITDFITVKIVNATQTNPVVITTAQTHGIANDDKVFITGVNGMTEINDTVFTAANVSAANKTFELSGIDGTGYTAYTESGQVTQCDEYEGEFANGFKSPRSSTAGRMFISDNNSRVGWLQGREGGTISVGGLHCGGEFLFGDALTFTASDTTPSVKGYAIFETDTGSVTITDFDDATQNQVIIIWSKGATTFDVTSSGLKGGTTDLVTASGDMTMWFYDGTDWRLLSFMDMSDNLS